VYLSGRNSIFHKLDPVTKFAFLGMVIVLAMFSIREWSHAFILFGIVTVFLLMCKPRAKEFFRPLKLLLPLFVPFVLLTTFVTFTIQSSVIGSFGAADLGTIGFPGFLIPYSKTGASFGFNIFLRGMTVAFASLWLSWTTHPRDLVYSLVNDFKINYKFAWGAFLALIYSPLIAYEGQMIVYSQRIRGVKYNKWNTTAVLKNLIIPLVLRGAKKAVVTAFALEGRAFGTYRDRTFRSKPKPSKYSRIVTIIIIAITIIYVVYYPPTMGSVFKVPGTMGSY
jgi:energy-coupling factor transport system permease protein